jgi:hypothetical protein
LGGSELTHAEACEELQVLNLNVSARSRQSVHGLIRGQMSRQGVVEAQMLGPPVNAKQRRFRLLPSLNRD